jgi:hypothetical protein
MYWNGMQNTIWKYVKNCHHTCQVNKWHKRKYGKLLPKLVIQKPWEALCVGPIWPYTLKGQDERNWCFVSDYDRPGYKLAQNHRIASGRRICHSLRYWGVQRLISTFNTKGALLDKSSVIIGTLVNMTWFSWYPCCQHVIYDNGSKFKLHFEALCDTYGIKRKPISVKSTQVNTILERVHQVIMAMLWTSELDMATSVEASDINTFLTNVAWAIHSSYHTVLKASQEAAHFGQDMLFDIPQNWRPQSTSNRPQHWPWKFLTPWLRLQKLMIKYFLEKMVSSANQKEVILGLSHTFIQMWQSGFNMEQNKNN